MAENNTHKEFFVAYGSKIIIALLAVLVLVAVVVKINQSNKNDQKQQAELLGQSFNFIYEGNDDKALAELERLIQNKEVTGLSYAKAALLAGNIKYKKGDFDGAAVLFQKSLDNAAGVDLITAAAMHGRASVAIEKQDYASAVGLLEKFIAKYGERTGNLSDRYRKAEPVDAVPSVPDALWKLALVYQQMGANDKAKATAEKLLKVYGDSQMYVDRAKKLIASL
jgi:outer membrane protein assembly factor BamD (BamD/ComL family)